MQRLVRLIERAQDFIFLLTVKANIFVYRHRIYIILKNAFVGYFTIE